MTIVEKRQVVGPTRSPPQVDDHLECRVHCRQVEGSKKEDRHHQVEAPEDPR